MLNGPASFDGGSQADMVLEKMLVQEDKEISVACRSPYLEEIHQAKLSKVQLA